MEIANSRGDTAEDLAKARHHHQVAELLAMVPL